MTDRMRGGVEGHAGRSRRTAATSATTETDACSTCEPVSNPAPSSSIWLSFVCESEPLGKPRMTQRDRWAQRVCVVRYRAWCDRIRKAAGQTGKQTLLKGCRVTIRAYFSIPKSWPRQARENAVGQAHLQTPDGDNVVKGIMDALFTNDQFVYFHSVEKRWDDGHGARVEVEVV